jgi:hypothetical protein
MFRLDKWYFDVVAPTGDAAIVYAAQVNMGVAATALQVGYAGVLWLDGTRVVTDSSLRVGRLPIGQATSWQNDALGIALDFVRGAALGLPETCILHTPDGDLRWHAWAPRVAMRLQWGHRTLEGTGYVERMTTTLARPLGT